MENNTFKLDTEKSVKKNFLDRVRVAFAMAIFLTGITSIVGIGSIVGGVVNQHWQEIGMARFVGNGFFYVSMMCIFVSLIKIALDAKPFSKTLSYCIRIISVLYLVGSVLFPRLEGYEASGFNILSVADFVLIDGAVLLFGLILFILGVLIQEGFCMQRELDEIL